MVGGGAVMVMATVRAAVAPVTALVATLLLADSTLRGIHRAHREIPGAGRQ